MKKGLIIAVVCLLGIGILFMGISVAVSGRTILGKVFSANSYELREEDFDADFSSLDITVNNTAIKLSASVDGGVHFSCYENDKVFYTVKLEGDELTVRQTDNRKWYDFIGINISSDKLLTLELPQSLLSRLSIDTSNAFVMCDDIDVTDTAELRTSNAGIKLNACTWGDSTVKASNGLISMENCTVESVNMKNSNALIGMKSCTFGSVVSDTSNAAISCVNTVADTFDLKTSNGAVNIEGMECRTVSAETSNALINVENIKAAELIYLKNSNGAVTGKLPGSLADYTVNSDTSNGSCNLPDSYEGGDIELRIKNSNGRINIDFDD